MSDMTKNCKALTLRLIQHAVQLILTAPWLNRRALFCILLARGMSCGLEKLYSGHWEMGILVIVLPCAFLKHPERKRLGGTRKFWLIFMECPCSVHCSLYHNECLQYSQEAVTVFISPVRIRKWKKIKRIQVIRKCDLEQVAQAL